MRMILDAGPFVAFDQGHAPTRARLAASRKLGFELITVSPVVAQVWRSGKQALLAWLLAATRIEAPNEAAAKRAGELLAKAKSADVVDALVIGLARDGDTVLTSDPDDMRRLATAARIDVNIVTV